MNVPRLDPKWAQQLVALVVLVLLSAEAVAPTANAPVKRGSWTVRPRADRARSSWCPKPREAKSEVSGSWGMTMGERDCIHSDDI